MQRKVLSIIIIFIVVQCGYTQNLIVNGSAEFPAIPPATGLFGWTQVSGNWAQAAYLPPQNGLFEFFPGAASTAELYQDVDVSSMSSYIDLGNTNFNFSGYIRSWNDVQLDQSRIVVEYLSATNAVLDTYDSGNLTSVGSPPDPNISADGWLQVADSRTAPTGTRTIRIRLISTRLHGSDNDGYYDNLVLTVDCAAGNITITSPTPICEGDNGALELQNYAGDIQWQRSYAGGAFTDFGTNNAIVTDAPTYADVPAMYRAVVSIGTCSETSAAVEIELSDVEGGTTAPSFTTICEGTSVDLSLSGEIATSIQWQYSIDNVTFINFGSGNNPETHTPVSNSNYYYRAEVTDDGCNDYSDTSVVNVTASPTSGTISSLPTTICEGEVLTLSISGQSGAIQWQESINGGTTWTNIGSGNTSELITPESTNSSFRALIGTGSCLSATNTLTPTIETAGDAGTFTLSPNPICDGDIANLSLSGYTATDFQWQESNDGGTSWSNIGANADAITVAPASADSPMSYRAIAMNGNCNDTSSTEILIINPTANAGTASINITTVCEGQNATLSLNGYTGAIEWFVSTNGGTAWTSLGLTTDNETIAPVASASTYLYRANVVSGSCGDISNNVSLDVTPNIAAGTITSNVNQTCDGESINFSLSGNSTSNIQWEKSTDNGATWSTFGGSTTNTTDSPTSTTPDLLYRAAVSNATCTAYTNELSHTVNPLPATGTLSISSNSICEGENVLLSITGNSGTLSWQARTNGSGTWVNTGVTTNTFNDTPLLADSPVEYRAIHVLGSCGDTSTVEQVTVSTTPSAGTITPSSANICENESLSLVLSGHSGTIEWQESTDLGASWSNTGETTTTQSLAAMSAGDYEYRAITTLGGCKDTSTAASVTISPSPVAGTINLSNNTVCEGNDLTAELLGYSGTLSSWQASLNGGITWNTGGPPTDQITLTPPNLGIPVLVRAISQLGTCYDTTSNVTITVNPSPTSGSISPGTLSLCEGENAAFTLSGHSGTVTWQETNDGGTTWSDNGNTGTTQALTNYAAGNYSFRVISSLGTCSDTTASVDAVISASPTAGNITATSTAICEGESVDFTLSGYSGVITTWEYSASNGSFWTNTGAASPTITETPSSQIFPLLYRAVVENGGCYDTTANFSMVVSPSPSAGTVFLSSNQVCNYEDAQANIGASTGNLRWQESNNGTTWFNRPESIPIINITPNFNTTRHFRVIAESNGCTDTSNTETLTTVAANAGILSSPAGICQNTSINLNMLGGGTTTNTWEYSYNNTTWTTLDNNTSSTSHTPPATETVVYFRIIGEDMGCYDTSNIRTVNLLEIVTDPSVISGPIDVCLGDTVSFSVPPVSNADYYQWQTTNGTEITNNNGNTEIRFDNGTSDIVRMRAGNWNCGPGNWMDYPITLHPTPSITTIADQIICKDDTIELSFTENNGLNTSMLTARWDRDGVYLGNGLTTEAFETGVYSVSVTYDFQCTTQSTPINITVQEVDVNSPTVIYTEKDTPGTIETTSNGDWNYMWAPTSFFNDAMVLSPQYITDQNFTATLYAVSDDGCLDSTVTNVIVVSELDIPNVFTPNDDGDNDYWKIQGIELLPQPSVIIFNRWGNEVYRSTGTYTPWDGTRKGIKVPVATYYYIIDSPELEKPKQGSVTIIR